MSINSLVSRLCSVLVPSIAHPEQFWLMVWIWHLFRKQKIPFCFADFLQLLDNNKVTTTTGEDAEIETVEWNVWENFATIDYKINRLYDNNFKITYL